MNPRTWFKVFALVGLVPLYAVLAGQSSTQVCTSPDPCREAIEIDGCASCPSATTSFPAKPLFAGCVTTVGTQGVCMGDTVDDMTCVESANDPCLKVGLGRINCCSPLGCLAARGARCPPSAAQAENDKACDPSEILPVGSGSGTCNAGFCEAGACTESACASSYSWTTALTPDGDKDLCKKDRCVNNSCQTLPVIADGITETDAHKCGTNLYCIKGNCAAAERPDR